MGLLLILFLLLTNLASSHAEEGDQSDSFPFRELMAPLMPLTQQPPVTVDLINRRKYLEASEVEEQDAAQFIAEKNFPWLYACALILTLTAMALIKLFPPPLSKKEEKAEITKEKLLLKIKELINQQPAEEKSIDAYLIQLDHAVREYLQKQYQVPLDHYTTEEFLEDALRHLKDDDKRLNLLPFLQKMDRFKFAHALENKEESAQAIRACRQLVQTMKGMEE